MLLECVCVLDLSFFVNYLHQGGMNYFHHTYQVVPQRALILTYVHAAKLQADAGNLIAYSADDMHNALLMGEHAQIGQIFTTILRLTTGSQVHACTQRIHQSLQMSKCSLPYSVTHKY